VGGRVVEMAEMEFMVRGRGYIKNIEDLENTSVSVDRYGTPILLKDIAAIQVGPELRRGLAELNGEGEVVGGIIVMRYGENALQVIKNVKKKLEELKVGLPDDVKITTVYDRSALIYRAVAFLREKLIEESIIVALVCIVFLLHFRSAFVAIFTLPVGILISFIIMYYQGINANIMSLGGIAIAIGAMVDAAIVMIENVHKHIEREGDKKDRWQIVIDASKEVGPALFFSLLIITLSFLPIFTLQAQEGRLFKPLAFTKTYAMVAAAFLSITIVPVLMGFLVRGKILPEERNPINKFLITIYSPVIYFVLRFKITTILIALGILIATVYPLRKLGSEFMPPLYEGDFLYMPTTLPGISITKARELLQQTDKIIKTFPQVHHVFGKVGRAETATDPAPLSMIETTIMLKPEEDWPKVKTVRWYSNFGIPGAVKNILSLIWPEEKPVTPEKLTEDMDRSIQFPGLTNAWTMPIKTRIDMLSTGIKTPVGIKIAGPKLEILQELGEQIEKVIRNIPGTLSVYSERVAGGNYLDFRIKRREAARYGLTVMDVQEIIMTAIGGMNITIAVEGLERYPVNLRYGRELRENIESLRRVLVSTPRGEHIPIYQLADIEIKKGPPGIKSENARLNAWIYVDIKGIDVGTYVNNARKILEESITFPPGYNLKWSGQYEYMERAKARLKMVIPLTLLIIFLLLYFNFKNITESLMVMLSLPFSIVGGIWFMYILDYNMSVAVGVGFIALAGIAAETGVIMIIYLEHAYSEVKEKMGTSLTIKDLYEAIIIGAVERVRPKIMTVTAIMG
ncbi:MAG: efflux RND transporter permease subunit, partial [Thermodesulfobacteriota bacterium]|nr:efflux RND transporter permease subunit [Thermodesulfobacteriota bacterium]